MAELINIFIGKRRNGNQVIHELRLDWDNDRYQAIHMDGLSPDEVIAAFVRASIEVSNEKREKQI